MNSMGYRALREGAAVLDLTGRGHLRVTGEDRVRLLHNLSTNHVKNLQPGEGLYAFFLTVQGRIQADAYLLGRADSIVIDTEPETAASLAAHIDKYIIADDVTVEDRTASTAVLGVEGPTAEAALAAAGVTVPTQANGWTEWDGRMVARISATGQPGFRIFLPVEEKPAVMERLGLPVASAEDAFRVRVENGVSRYGDDFTAESLPQETQRMEAVHFQKGCYLGQEIVERLRARGHVNWLLSPLVIEAAAAPARGTKLMADGKEVGEVTSAVVSGGEVRALAWIRAEQVKADAAFTVDGAAARVPSGGA